VSVGQKHTVDAVLEKVQWAVMTKLSGAAFAHLVDDVKTAGPLIDYGADELLVQARLFLYAIPDQKVEWSCSYPAGWWQHLKQTILPAWVQRWWPVKLTTRTYSAPMFRACCPHLNEEPDEAHLRWLAGQCVPREFGFPKEAP